MIDVLVIGNDGETDLKCPECGTRLYAKWIERKLSFYQIVGEAPMPVVVVDDRPFALNCENSREVMIDPHRKRFCPNPTIINRDPKDGKWPRLLFLRSGLIGVPLKDIPPDWH